MGERVSSRVDALECRMDICSSAPRGLSASRGAGGNPGGGTSAKDDARRGPCQSKAGARPLLRHPPSLPEGAKPDNSYNPTGALQGMDDEVARELNEIRTRFDELMEAIRQASISERTSSEAASVKLAALDNRMADMRQEQVRTSKAVADMRQGMADMRQEQVRTSKAVADMRQGMADMRQEQVRTRQEVADMRQEQARTRQEVGKMNDKIDNLENDLQKALQKTIRTELRDIRDAIQDREKLEA